VVRQEIIRRISPERWLSPLTGGYLKPLELFQFLRGRILIAQTNPDQEIGNQNKDAPKSITEDSVSSLRVEQSSGALVSQNSVDST
jgi:hypothetical protein